MEKQKVNIPTLPMKQEHSSSDHINAVLIDHTNIEKM